MKLVAEQGKSDAYLILGLAYMNIKDIPRDLVQADMWLNLAARGGDPLAPAQIVHAEQQMTSDQISKARASAAAWKPSKPSVSTTADGSLPRREYDSSIRSMRAVHAARNLSLQQPLLLA